jgi:cell division protein FtsW
MNNQFREIRTPIVKTYDKLLLFLMLLLLSFGALMIYSSTSVVTPIQAKKNITEFFYFKKHLMTMALGFIALFFTYKLKPSLLKRMAFYLLIFSFLLLILVFIPDIGIIAGGARRWIRLWPTTFQPSELVKLSMVIYLARYMSMPNYNTESFLSFVKPLIVMVVFQVVFLKQPDFGAAMSLAFLTFAMFFISGMRLRYLASVILLAIPIIYKLIMEPYRLKRIITFLDPYKDPLGDGFQLVQAFIAFGSGGLTGLGLGESKQKLSFLPASHTDFIFGLLGEELGLIGASVVIALFILLFIRGISIANKSKDSFVYYLAYGLTLMISLQALTNFAVVTGLVPTKGLPLPFMSYGGSALLVNMVAVGILMKISKGDEDGSKNENNKLKTKILARRRIYSRKGYRL